MRRRGFLKTLLGAALVPIVGKAVPTKLKVHGINAAGNACVEEMASNVGFGLCPVKAEGSIADYDLLPSKRWVSHQAIENGVWDNVNKRYLAQRDDMVLLEYDET